jgi:hypothetical protein
MRSTVSSPARLALSTRSLTYFIIQSNLIVGATCPLLAWKLGWPSTVFNVFRLIGVVAIAVTGVVYHVALAGLLDLDSWGPHRGHDPAHHRAGGRWARLLYGPRGFTSRRIAELALLFPLFYMVFTTIRGAIVGFYPYPFSDANVLGYPRVIINGVWITLLFYGMAGEADALDKVLTRRAAESSPTPDRW